MEGSAKTYSYAPVMVPLKVTPTLDNVASGDDCPTIVNTSPALNVVPGDEKDATPPVEKVNVATWTPFLLMMNSADAVGFTPHAPTLGAKFVANLTDLSSG